MLSIGRDRFPAKSQTLRSYRVYISPTGLASSALSKCCRNHEKKTETECPVRAAGDVIQTYENKTLPCSDLEKYERNCILNTVFWYDVVRILVLT